MLSLSSSAFAFLALSLKIPISRFSMGSLAIASCPLTDCSIKASSIYLTLLNDELWSRGWS